MTVPAPRSAPGCQPAPSAPVGNYLTSQFRPGISPDGQYVVLPRAVLERLPRRLQHLVVDVLNAVHAQMPVETTPVYRVGPSAWFEIDGLDEERLQEAGIIVEFEADGELVYRDLRTGHCLTEDERHLCVLLDTPDPLSQGVPERC
ncbi:hypothetical protein [Amycolatopsis nigrescens]|uniref:hypothetical protein n=1 Tax=Amycolatopsis nigrescens TaxID=381445 RepID=UPI00036C2408|nr:hypothetical protein [Amycolatopsis nigrescens]